MKGRIIVVQLQKILYTQPLRDIKAGISRIDHCAAVVKIIGGVKRLGYRQFVELDDLIPIPFSVFPGGIVLVVDDDIGFPGIMPLLKRF